MTEDIKDFFKGLQERVSSPFFISYIISWCIINYPIIIGLLFYKQSELINDGYRTYLEFIQRQLASRASFTGPLAYALAYTIFAPVIKEVARYIKSLMTTYTDTKIIKATEKRSILFERHTELANESLEKSQKLYFDLIERQKETVTQNEQLNADIIKLREDHAAQLREKDLGQAGEIHRLHEEREDLISNIQTLNAEVIFLKEQMALSGQDQENVNNKNRLLDAELSEARQVLFDTSEKLNLIIPDIESVQAAFGTTSMNAKTLKEVVNKIQHEADQIVKASRITGE